MQISVCHVNNKALIHLNCQKQHSLQSSNPITKACKKWVMTLSSSVAMYSVMRDKPDARKVPMEGGWVILYLYATCKLSNLLTLEQWAFEYGLPFLDTHCIPPLWIGAIESDFVKGKDGRSAFWFHLMQWRIFLKYQNLVYTVYKKKQKIPKLVWGLSNIATTNLCKINASDRHIN